MSASHSAPALACALSAALCSSVGCSAIVDTDECGVSEDCERFNTAAERYTCVAGTCELETGGTGEAPKTAFLYVGPVGDYGWTRTHDEGRKALEAAIPGVQTTFEPSVNPADAGTVIERWIGEGQDLIIGTSIDFLTPMLEAAANHPETKFLICSGFKSTPNLGSYFGRMYQVKWLAGRLAGQITKSNRIGYVSSVRIPETIRHINAFTLGVRSVNPNAVVMVSFTEAWFDPPTEKTMANALMDFGVDVITNGTDTSTTIEEANKRTDDDGKHTVWSIGYDNPDVCALFAPDSCVASAYYDWGPVLERQVRSIMDGSWDPTNIIWDRIVGDQTKSTVYLQWGKPQLVSSAIRNDVESFIRDFADGIHDPFEGNVKDNRGGTRSGLEDDDLLRMCWFVDGVVEPGASPPFAPKQVGSGCIGDP